MDQNDSKNTMGSKLESKEFEGNLLNAPTQSSLIVENTSDVFQSCIEKSQKDDDDGWKIKSNDSEIYTDEDFDSITSQMDRIREKVHYLINYDHSVRNKYQSYRLRGGNDDDDEDKDKTNKRLSVLLQKIKSIEKRVSELKSTMHGGPSTSKIDEEKADLKNKLKIVEEDYKKQVEVYQVKFEQCTKQQKSFQKLAKQLRAQIEQTEKDKERLERRSKKYRDKYKKNAHTETYSDSTVSSISKSSDSNEEILMKFERNEVLKAKQSDKDIDNNDDANLLEHKNRSKKEANPGSQRNDSNHKSLVRKQQYRMARVKKADDNDDEDLKCRRMKNATFTKFTVQNMMFSYFWTYNQTYVDTGLFEFFPYTDENGVKRRDCKIKLKLGTNHLKDSSEIRFKRMENLVHSHMVYYSYRTAQQLVDRIIAETWTQWFPKRFYMPFEFFRHDKKKPPAEVPDYSDRFDEAFGHVDFKHYYSAQKYLPTCIPIPPGTKRKIWARYDLDSWMDPKTNDDFICHEYTNVMVRYCWGLYETRPKPTDKSKLSFFWDFVYPTDRDIWWSTTPVDRNAFSMIDCLKGEYQGQVHNMYGECSDHPQYGWRGWKVQGFNSKKVPTDDLYKKWGKCSSDFDIPNKRRSDAP